MSWNGKWLGNWEGAWLGPQETVERFHSVISLSGNVITVIDLEGDKDGAINLSGSLAKRAADLLLEGGGMVLLEDEGHILLEAAAVVGIDLSGSLAPALTLRGRKDAALSLAGSRT